MMSKNVICIGEALIDFVCTGIGDCDNPTEVYLKKPGGAPANVAACIGRLGGRAEFLGAVGNDAFGTYLVGELEKFAVATNYVQQVNIPTTLAFVTIQDDGEREFVFNRGADGEFLVEAFITAAGCSNSICHFGSATAFLEGKLKTAYFALAEHCASKDILISFDPNYRADLWQDDLPSFIEMCNTFFKLSDMVKVSEEELQLLTGEYEMEKGCGVIHGYGVKTIFVTRGSNGCYLSTQQNATTVAAFKINPVDTTGAGDAFIGATLFKLSSYTSINAMTFEDLLETVQFAQKVSAYVCEKLGAMTALPTEYEVSSRQFQIASS